MSEGVLKRKSNNGTYSLCSPEIIQLIEKKNLVDITLFHDGYNKRGLSLAMNEPLPPLIISRWPLRFFIGHVGNLSNPLTLSIVRDSTIAANIEDSEF